MYSCRNRLVLLAQRYLLAAALLLLAALPAHAQIRARDLGIPFDGSPGPLNAITDVAGVEVGHSTVIHGEGKLVVGQGPARTGVTAIFPTGKNSVLGAPAGHFTFNGDGEMTGSRFVDEFGYLHGPILLTNTLSIGAVSQAVIEWNRLNVTKLEELYARGLPLVAETWDGFLNDIYGQHVKASHVFAALDGAAGGVVAEGNVGGGTGMSTFEFSGGIGTASRQISTRWGSYVLGVLVQSNFGDRAEFELAGVKIGQQISDLMPEEGSSPEPGGKSIIVIVATDAPLIPTQLKRLARRATLALGRLGGMGHSGSGDIFLAFSTADAAPAYWSDEVYTLRSLPDMNPLFEATVQATEEAIINALVAGRSMTGADGNVVHGLPHDRVRNFFRPSNP